jgi:hypothetical protein
MGCFWQFADKVGLAIAIGDRFYHSIVFPVFFSSLEALHLKNFKYFWKYLHSRERLLFLSADIVDDQIFNFSVSANIILKNGRKFFNSNTSLC